jgi:hypothetical protein
MPANVVAVQGRKKCKPFILEVMVYSPHSGYKFEVSVERGCSAQNDSIWKIVFDLYKKKLTGNDFDQIVHVSYRGLNAQENAKIAGMIDGVSEDQVDALVDKVHPAAVAFSKDPSSTNKAKVEAAMQKVANS